MKKTIELSDSMKEKLEAARKYLKERNIQMPPAYTPLPYITQPGVNVKQTINRYNENKND